ncbi:O-antigen ligase family protein [Lutimonas vermicola]|uniref:O-antigen ligase family protein n=1 Tax=Lutimonas vermicola TaxID=414288 RepID=A0ABU9L1Y4_9FLAO
MAGLSEIFDYQSLVTYGLMPITFIYALYTNRFKSYSLTNFYSIIFSLLIIWSAFLIIILPVDFEMAIKTLLKILGVYLSILITIEILSNKSYDYITSFLWAFIISYYIIVYFLMTGNYDIDISSGEYIYRGRFDLNANAYSYFSFFANMALFYLIEIKRKPILVILSFITIGLGIYVSFLTSSRSGLLFTSLTGVIYWVFIFDGYKINPLLKVTVTVGLTLVALTKLFEFYKNSYLKYRVDEAVQYGDSRQDLIKDAFNVFQNNAFTGVGPGQYALYSFHKGSFSHNSFTEAAANLGIIGLIILLILLITPFLNSLRVYFKNIYSKNKNILKLNILFFSIFILYNNFYVFYLTTYGMIFFMIIVHLPRKNYGNT